MAITIHIDYTGEGDNALRFAREMLSSSVVKQIRAEAGQSPPRVLPPPGGRRHGAAHRQLG